MSKNSKSENSSKWTHLCAAADYEFRRVLVAILNLTVAKYHNIFGEDAYKIFKGKSFHYEEVTHVFDDDLLRKVGKAYGASYSRARALCILAGCNLDELIAILFETANLKPKQSSSDTNRALVVAVTKLNIAEAVVRCSVEPPIFFIDVRTRRFQEALSADNSDEAHDAIAYLAVEKTVTSEEFKSRWPDLYQRVIEPIIGHQTYVKIGEPLFDKYLAQQFCDALDAPRREADELIGFGHFIPCTLESTNLMHAHHRGLAERLLGGERERLEAFVNIYNMLGEANAKSTLAQLRLGAIHRFFHIMKESALNEIVKSTGDFQYVDAQCLFEWRQTLRQFGEEFGDRVRIVIIAEDNENIFLERFDEQTESIFFYSKGGRPLSAVTREPDGSLQIHLDSNQINYRLALLTGIVAVGRSYTLGEFDQLLVDKSA